MKISATCLSILALAFAITAPAEEPPKRPTESKQPHDARMAWWREAKFGLFIHWGVFAVPAGIYQGKPVHGFTESEPGFSEWLMYYVKMPAAQYQAFAKQFNPVKFDAESWVLAAKNAGMRYIIITAKHHDGFAMFQTRASPWNIVQASPYGKDPLQALAAACRRHGMRLGFYYSQAQDWNNGGAVGLFSMGKNAPPPWDPVQHRDMDDYIEKIAAPQVTELCSNYGEFPDVLWWDTPRDMNPSRAQKLHDIVQSLRPGIIMNNRLGGGLTGDTETPENFIPARGYPGRDWETCMTMNTSWGYKEGDEDWKSPETLIRSLCDIASKGGNFLLNVGPNAEGLIPQGSLDRLATVGRWMQVNGEAIYGSGPTPFGEEAGKFSDSLRDAKGQPVFEPAWSWRATTKPGKIHLILFQWPTDGRFVLPGTPARIRQCYLLADRRPIPFTQTDTGTTLVLPAQAPDAIASVVCVELEPAASASR